jgi:hypothetical protein
METKSFLCSGCGAELEYEPNNRSLQCPYCGSNTELVRDDAVLLYKPDFIIPLSVDKESLNHAVESYMVSGDYTPDDLIEKALITKLEMTYRPAFVFSGDFEAKWTASFGYDRTEHYTVYENKYDSDLKRNIQTPVTKTKTVTDWQPNSGVASGDYHLIGYAGGVVYDPSVLGLIEGCSWSGAVGFSEEFLAQMTVEPPANTADEAFSTRVEGRLQGLIDRSVKAHAQGDRQRDWHWNARRSRSDHSALIPICHAQFEYESATYDFWTDGTATSRSTGDRLPVDKGRKNGMRLGFVPLIVLSVATVILAITSEGHTGLSPLNILALAGALLYGLLRRSAIRSHSHRARSKALTQRRAERSALVDISEENRGLLASSLQMQRRPLLAHTGKDFFVLPLLIVFLILPLIAEGVKNAEKPTQLEVKTVPGPVLQSQTDLVNTPSSQPEVVDDKAAMQSALQSNGYAPDGEIIDFPAVDTASNLHAVKVSCISAEQSCNKLFVFAGHTAIWSETLDITETLSSIAAVGAGAFSAQLTQHLPDGSNSTSKVLYKWDGINMSRVVEPSETSPSNVNLSGTQATETSSASQAALTDGQADQRVTSASSMQAATGDSSPAPIVRQPPTNWGNAGSYDGMMQSARYALQRNDLGDAYRLATQARATAPNSLPALELLQIISTEEADSGRAEAAALDLINHGGKAVFRLQHYHAWPSSLHPARLIITSETLEYIPDAQCKYADFTVPLKSIKSVGMSTSMSHVNLVDIKFDDKSQAAGREAKGKISFAEPQNPFDSGLRRYGVPSPQDSNLLKAIAGLILQLQKQL